MGLPELFVAALITGLSAINAVVPLGAWSRTRDPRLLLVAGANGCLLLVGALWAWGQLPGGPTEFGTPSWPILILALGVALLLLGTALVPRRT
ncbi:MAG: hypothetical protein L3K14_02125 [Thermoplasmata archaeon]|nr:hypothetical protein [Thermoplasmata archaeon]